MNQLVVPQATNCSPAVQFQSSTTWQLIPECNTDVSLSRDHCCYCSPPDWEALPAFGIVCQINLANILQINWCRAPGVRTDIDAEGNSHPESQWQKENVARVSMTGEHSLRRKRWKKVEGGETSREKERENKNDFMGKPWEAEQNLPHQRGESWCRQPDHRYMWRSKAWQCYLVFACKKKNNRVLPKNSSDMCEDSPPKFTGELLLFLWMWGSYYHKLK